MSTAAGVGPEPYVSVITPTFGRPEKLPHLYTVFASQGVDDSEMIVIDDSEQRCAFMDALSDPRVRYIHLAERLSIGEKRNLAIEAARGQIIVQFDDDDYYSPKYIRAMIEFMRAEKADFVKLSAFFLYSKILKAYGYWETQRKGGIHFAWDGSTTLSVVKFEPNVDMSDAELGYGFSYVFKKTVWRSTPFQPISFGEDAPFVRAAIASGLKLLLVNDNSGLLLHILHGGNASIAFPQYIIPNRLIHPFFNGLDPSYLE
jgi:glycosyltransferase involved in cell wall biosynthesis